MKAPLKLLTTVLLSFGLLILTVGQSVAKENKRSHKHAPTRAEAKEAERRLSEMGYWTGPADGVIDSNTRTALIAFQKYEGREVTGRLSLDELHAILDANRPKARDTGYEHVEIDIDRQVLLLVDEDGAIQKILPVSTGSGKQYREKGGRGLAYTPKGRFRIYGKASGWKRSPLGLLYYPNYFSDGVAIHGNPSVPSRPESHGCVRIPMFASRTISKLLPVGTIVLVYDKNSFVSAQAWGEADKQKRSARIP